MDNLSFDFILNNLEEGIIAIDSNLAIRGFNRAAEEITGWKAAEVLGKPCYEIMRNSHCPPSCEDGHLHENCLDHLSQVLIRSKEGNSIPIRISNVPIKDKNNNICGAIKMFSDQRSLYATDLGKFRQMGLVGMSPEMKEVFQLIETVAPTDSTVLILGKTGTGKELVANAIHRFSARRDRPFIKVNCTALSESLLESELFGHEKGAFTGALASRAGRFEAANKGTIFLDEISEICPGFQSKLLRVLQEGEFERVGSSRTIKVDVRVIAATNKDLYQLVQQQLFRDDLYYRLNVFPIYLPALAEIKEDIGVLVKHFINHYNVIFKQQKLDISSEALDILMQYDFPGNVRELKNIIEHAFIKSDSMIIENCDLPAFVLKHSKSSGNDPEKGAAKEHPQLREVSREREIDYILRVIEECRGNKSKASRVLGIARKTLYNKLGERLKH